MSNIYKRAFLFLLAALGLSTLTVFFLIDKTNLQYWYSDFTRDKQPYTLLLGSSSIDRLPVSQLPECIRPVIYGFDNGTTESISAYLSYAKLKNVNKVILYIGENDIARGENPNITFNQIKAIVQDIEAKSSAKIGLVKIKYSLARLDSHAGFIELNRMLDMYYGKSERVTLIPFDKIMDKRWFVSDGVHLNNDGNLKFSEWINEFCLGNK